MTMSQLLSRKNKKHLTTTSMLLNQCQGYDICQKPYLEFFRYWKKQFASNELETSHFIFLMLLLAYIIVWFWCIRSIINLNEEFYVLQTRQLFIIFLKEIIPGCWLQFSDSSSAPFTLPCLRRDEHVWKRRKKVVFVLTHRGWGKTIKDI